MNRYHIRFLKTLCDDYGHQHRCTQGDIHLHRARTEPRALRAAKPRFQRSKKTGNWKTHADDIEIVRREPPDDPGFSRPT